MEFDKETNAFINNSLSMCGEDMADSPKDARKKTAAQVKRGGFRRASKKIKHVQVVKAVAATRPERRRALDLDNAMANSIPDEAKDLLIDIDHWGFDIFALSKTSNYHPLVAMMWGVIVRLNLVDLIQMDLDKLYAFCLKVEEGHHHLPYHSRIHSADVTHGVFWFIHTGQLGEKIHLTPHEMYVNRTLTSLHKTVDLRCVFLPATLKVKS